MSQDSNYSYNERLSQEMDRRMKSSFDPDSTPTKIDDEAGDGASHMSIAMEDLLSFAQGSCSDGSFSDPSFGLSGTGAESLDPSPSTFHVFHGDSEDNATRRGARGVENSSIDATRPSLLTPVSATFPPSSPSSSLSSLSSESHDYTIAGSAAGNGGDSASGEMRKGNTAYPSVLAVPSSDLVSPNAYPQQGHFDGTHFGQSARPPTFIPSQRGEAQAASYPYPYSFPYSPGLPSLSPLSISTPSFVSAFPHHSGSPITPITPHTFQQHSPSHPGGSPSSLRSADGFSYGHVPPGLVPLRRQASYISPNLDESSRARLKRSYSDFSPALANPDFANARQAALAEAAFIGPLSEVESAAQAALTAAAKTGAGAGAFVYKVYHMLLDPESQQFIRFADSGKSFIVGNTTDFAREVLPKHFKHSNFSSFVRQLNMYGFHKVNKTPRGQGRVAESLAWEFMHPKFARGEPQKLDEIKRRATDSDLPASTVPAKMTRSMSGALERRVEKPSSPSPELSEEERKPAIDDSLAASDSLQRPPPGFVLEPTPKRSTGTRTPALAPNMEKMEASNRAHEQARADYHRAQRRIQRDQHVQQSAQPGPLSPPAPLPPSSYQQQPLSSSHLHRQMPAAFTPYRTSASAAIPPQQPSPHLPAFKAWPATTESVPAVPGRMEMLERQRDELSTALSGARESYELLYRELLDTRRKQDSLFILVKDMYRVLAASGDLDRLPYSFPLHLFPPGTFNPGHHSGVTLPSTSGFDPHSHGYRDQYQQEHGIAPPHLAGEYSGQAPSHAYHEGQNGYSAAAEGSSGASALHTNRIEATLAPALHSFHHAIETPLPPSPLPQQHSGSSGMTHPALTGLRIGVNSSDIEMSQPVYDDPSRSSVLTPHSDVSQ